MYNRRRTVLGVFFLLLSHPDGITTENLQALLQKDYDIKIDARTVRSDIHEIECFLPIEKTRTADRKVSWSMKAGESLVQISKVLSYGNTVYSAANGQPMKVTRVYSTGFDTDVDYFSYDEHRKLFWLHERSYKDSVRNKENGYGKEKR